MHGRACYDSFGDSCTCARLRTRNGRLEMASCSRADNGHWTDLLLIGWLTKEGEVYLGEVCVQQEPEEFACGVNTQPGSEPQQHRRFDCTGAG